MAEEYEISGNDRLQRQVERKLLQKDKADALVQEQGWVKTPWPSGRPEEIKLFFISFQWL